jgi:hypothetical protein
MTKKGPSVKLEKKCEINLIGPLKNQNFRDQLEGTGEEEHRMAAVACCIMHIK